VASCWTLGVVTWPDPEEERRDDEGGGKNGTVSGVHFYRAIRRDDPAGHMSAKHATRGRVEAAAATCEFDACARSAAARS